MADSFRRPHQNAQKHFRGLRYLNLYWQTFCLISSYVDMLMILVRVGLDNDLWPLLLTAWISNHMPIMVWNEITYPFSNFNGGTVEVWEWISNFIPHIIMDVITLLKTFTGTVMIFLHCAAVEFWEWISNFIPLSNGHVITHPCWD